MNTASTANYFAEITRSNDVALVQIYYVTDDLKLEYRSSYETSSKGAKKSALTEMNKLEKGK